jgi:cytochrome oxidase Cu insertion factor (SCO1/SenC/PrrC family)
MAAGVIWLPHSRGDLMRRTVFPVLLAMALTGSAFSQAAPAKPAAQKQEAPPEPRIKVGDMAPDFTLRDQNRKEVKLSDFRGKNNVIVAFFVFAFTGG